MTRPRRWLVLGAGLSLLGLAMGLLVADQFPHGYSGATIRVRGWLVMLSAAVAVPSALGMLCFAKAAPWPPLKAIFALAGLLWLAHLGLLAWLRDVPIEPTGGWATMLWLLVFLPALLRTVGVATSRYGRVFGLFDVVLIIIVWAETPIEVLARAHPGQGTWWMVLPCAAGLALMGLFSDP